MSISLQTSSFTPKHGGVPNAPDALAGRGIIAAGYIRLTRDESLENNLSAPAQRKGIQDYAERAKLTPIHMFEETRAVGGDVPFTKREAGSCMIAAIRSGQLKHVIVRDIDRLTRDLSLGMEFVTLCHEFKVSIHTLTGVVQTRSASDRFAFQVRSAAAEFEKNQTADRVRKAKREAVEQGRWQGPPAYGYTSQADFRRRLIASGVDAAEAEIRACTEYPQKAKLYVDANEARTLTLIYQLAESGLGSRKIIGRLNQAGYRTRTGAYWSTERLSRTLGNPAAAGYLASDSEREATGVKSQKLRLKLWKGNHEPIVSLTQWQDVQRRRQANNRPGRRLGSPSQRRYVLSGILRCQCGSPMRGKSQRASSPGRYVCCKAFYYGKRTVNGCDHVRTTLNADDVHAAFWPALHRLLSGPGLLSLLENEVSRALRQGGRKEEAGESKAHLEKVERQLSLWYRRHDEAFGDAEQEAAWRRVVELTEQKNVLVAGLADADAQSSRPSLTPARLASYLEKLGALTASADPDEVRGFVRTLSDDHGLSLQMVGPEECRLSLPSCLTATDHGSKTVGQMLSLPRDGVGRWVKEQQGSHRCLLCDQTIMILRRHRWMGIPKHHRHCFVTELAKNRHQRYDGLLSAAALARKLGVSPNTVVRRLAAGKLPAPCLVEGGRPFWAPSAF